MERAGSEPEWSKTQLKDKAKTLAEVFSAPARMWKDARGPLTDGTTSYAGSITQESARV